MDSSRINTILSASKIRQDDIGRRPELSDGSLTLKCHKICISKYVSPSTLGKLDKRMRDDEKSDDATAAPKRLRSNTGSAVFDFRKHCLFCYDVTPCTLPHEYELKVPQQYRTPASIVLTVKMADGVTSYKQYLLDLCQKRDDELCRRVRDRILGAQSDLHAADARYHRKCNAAFHVGTHRINDKDSEFVADDQAFSETVTAMCSDPSKVWNSLDVEAVYSDKGGCVMSRRVLVQKVIQHFGDEMLPLHSPGMATLLVFRKHVAKNLRLIDDDENDFTDECVRKLGRQIMKECEASKHDFKSYNKHIDWEVASECVSETLIKLLSAISPKFQNSLQSLMVGNIVSSKVTGQPTPLQIAIGVLLGDHKMLIQELYKYNVSCSYDEVRRFKRSAAVQSSKANKQLAGLRDVTVAGLVQIIIDNFDAVISSQNCRLECHCMAMLATQWNHLENQGGLDTTILRISKEEMKQPVPWETPVVQYKGPKKPLMPLAATVQFEISDDFIHATQVSLARARDLDFTFLNDVLFKANTPEYNGYNTRLCRESGMSPAPKSAVVYLPLINMKPTDPTTVLTSITRGIEVTRNSNQDILVLTCDQAIYKIVVDITFHQPELLTNVVPILGGMHFLMDFVSCIGTLLADGGLKEILSTTFGSIDKMLQGKKYPQNVRALRLLTEELLQPVFEKDNLHITSMDDLENVLDELSALSRTTKMWVNNIIKPTFLMMRFCRASHEGDWALHIKTAEDMLPYMFAAHKYNYGRYGLYYVRSMTWLEPKILDRFCRGEQSLHHTAGIYNGQWSDMFIETNWMRKGHGPSGIIGMTESPQTMATWVFSMDATMTLIGDFKKMSGGEDNVQMTHKEESPSRIGRDGDDRQSLRRTLLSCINPMDPDTHVTGSLLNIWSGQLAQPNVNVDRALDIGREQLIRFERLWPEGFYNSLSNEVVTFATKKKRLTVGEHAVIDQEAIYARVIGLLVSQRDLNFQQVIATELTAYPPSMFHADGKMRIATGKSTLKKNIQVEVSQRLTISPTAIVMDVSAVIWTIDWPAHGTIGTFISGFKLWLSRQLSEADVYMCFDRYHDYSTKSSTRSARATASRVHHFTLTTPLPARDAVLKNYSNKARLNTLICEQILSDKEFLQNVTHDHKLVVTGDNSVPTQVSKGRKSARLDLASTHEEADIFITQQAIHIAKEDAESRVCVVCDDTDVFALLLFFYFSEKLESSMRMQSPIKGRSCIDIKETAHRHANIVPSILALHALTGCDSVAATHGVGKVTAIAVARKGHILDQLGQPTADIIEVVKQSTAFMAACYGCKTPCSTMTECRQQQWAQKTGKSTSAPKLCSLPPTTEAFEQNVRRAHYQVAQWYSALSGDPPPLNAVDYGWEADDTNKCLIPRNMKDGVPYAPEHILKLVKCGCLSERPCRGGNCGCMGHQLPCTMFCACGGGPACLNPFNAREHATDDTNDTDDVDNQQVDNNDEEEND